MSSRAITAAVLPPEGRPGHRRSGMRFSQSMNSSLTNQGKLRFVIYEGAIQGADLSQSPTTPVRHAASECSRSSAVLQVQRAHEVTAWVQDHADQWDSCTCSTTHRGELRRIPQIMTSSRRWRAVARHGSSRRSSPVCPPTCEVQRCRKVRAFFQNTTVRYAA